MKLDSKLVIKYLKNLIYPLIITIGLYLYFHISYFNLLNLIYWIAFITCFSLVVYFTNRYVKKNNIHYSLVKRNIPLTILVFSLLMPLSAFYYRTQKIYVDDYKDLAKNTHNKDAKFILTNDIDMSEAKIGRNNCYYNSFVGNLDCNGYAFSNVKAPLFLEIYHKSKINELTIKNAAIESNDSNIGIVAITNEGVVNNVHVEGSIKGLDNLGGLFAFNKGEIANSSFKGEIKGRDVIGGIASENSSTIKNCATSGFIEGNNKLASISGIHSKYLYDCYSNMDIKGSSGGALAGEVTTYTYNYEINGDNDTFGKYEENNEKSEEIEMPSLIVNSVFLGSLTYDVLDGDVTSKNINGNFLLTDKLNVKEYKPINKEFYFLDSDIKEKTEYDEEFLVSKDELLKEEFLINNLNLSKKIWNYNVINEGYFPHLKNKLVINVKII